MGQLYGLVPDTVLLVAFALLLMAAPAAVAAEPQESPEPNVEIAKTWWREMPNKWTAVGWKDHILRFNVLHNGAIINQASWMDRMRPALQDPQALFYFRPGATPDEFRNGVWPEGTNPLADDGSVVQGWNDTVAPVLWSEWQYFGQLIRQEVFAHVPGGKALTRGDEPLFAWVRLSMPYKAEGVPVADRCGMGVQINNPSLNVDMKKAWTLRYHLGQRQYKNELRAEAQEYDPGRGFHVLEPDGRVRMAVAPGRDCEVTFQRKWPAELDSALHVSWPAAPEHHVDILIPMLPMDRETFDRELALGYDAALREAEQFWSRKAATAARFDVPEKYVNDLILRNLQTNEVTSERDPETGDYTLLTGGMGYGAGTWATPTSITMAAMYIPLGYHDVVNKYVQGVKKYQGKVTPPGDAYELHPGYLSLPLRVSVVHWLADHGSLLWVISQNALLSGDPALAEEWTPVILKACEWIQYARAIENHPGVKGIMPPAGWSDDESRVQAVWSDGWTYLGLTSAVAFLKSIDHPRAAEFEREARDYREAFQTAYEQKLGQMDTWTGPDGVKRRMAPHFLTDIQPWQWKHVFYLDGGPLHMVFSNLLDPTHPAIEDTLLWFREGPPTKLARLELDYNHMPFLVHEISSWEICYSWNIFHSWRTRDRQKFLEGVYSMMTGGYSQQTFSACEERGGMLAATNWLPTILHLRNAVVDDEIREDELHLLRLVPLAWLTTEREARFEKMPTRYGPVTLRAGLDGNGGVLDVHYTADYRSRPGRVVLHVPPVEGLKRVRLNGRTLDWDGRAESILLP